MSTFGEIKASTARYLKENDDVKINEEALRKFAATIRPQDLREAERTPFPLKFPDRASELNFLGLLNILNFGSGYREELHQHCNRGAYDTIAGGCIAMHISQTINADLLLNMKLVDIPQLFRMPIDVDVQVKPAMYTTKPSSVRPLASKIVAVCNECGRIMRSRGWDGFADFVMEALREIRRKKSQTPAADFVRACGEAFPAFRDRYEVLPASTASDVEESKDTKDEQKDQQDQAWYVSFYKKAQLFAGDVHRRFGPEDPLFHFEDIHSSTVCADNVLPAVLRHFGILETSDELLKCLDARKPLGGKDAAKECALRAGAVTACEMILQWLRENAKAQFVADTMEVEDAKADKKSTENNAMDEEAKVSVGSKVALHGLSRAEFNGVEAIVVGKLKEGRHAIELLPEDRHIKNARKKINVKPANLKLVASYTRPGFQPLSEKELQCARTEGLDETEDRSCGCVVFRVEKGEVPAVLMIRHTKKDSPWTFPKGHQGSGEDDQTCAVRETLEETGVQAAPLESGVVDERYSFIGKLHIDKWKKHGDYPDSKKRPMLVTHKSVRYLPAKEASPSGELRPTSEAQAVEWVPINEVVVRSTVAEFSRKILQSMLALPSVKQLFKEVDATVPVGAGAIGDNTGTDGVINSGALDFYLWKVLGKQPEIRKVPRHLMQDTVFY